MSQQLFLCLAVGLASLTSLVGCPSQNHDKGRASSLPPCTRFGDNCELAPGKLGSCVVRDGCTEANCFVCQSQH